MKAVRSNILGTTQADPVLSRAPYTLDIEGESFRVFQAESIAIGTDMREGRPVNLTVLLCLRGRDLGGMGRCAEFQPSVEHARELARNLLTFADEVEAAATEQADAALRKAAGR
ncbi:hypothetical protein [uncultured Sphingomonas sp.]|uniref:hypothetical protein n=1 Tax=uncultured Sphingomonas sp. TaxID=158754 RepID=UPI0025E55AA8|nr:hypothetical protein [uncultured Sphingomonas sp.]